MKNLNSILAMNNIMAASTLKRVALVALVLILAVWLAGCATTSAASNDAAPAETDELPLVSELAVGTLALDDTDLAVDAEQAAALRPLWMAYISLSSDDAASSIETNALIDQVQETLTGEQIATIEAMDLSQADMMAVMEELGLEMGGGMGDDADTEDRAAMREQMAQGELTGERPEGMVEGMGVSSSGDAGDEDMAAMRAQMQSQMVTPLIEALVEMLEAIS